MLVLALIAAAPHRPDRVDDPLRRESVAAGHLCFARARANESAAPAQAPQRGWMAPSTPPPPPSAALAALTMASTVSRVMPPCAVSMRSPG